MNCEASRFNDFDQKRLRLLSWLHSIQTNPRDHYRRFSALARVFLLTIALTFTLCFPVEFAWGQQSAEAELARQEAQVVQLVKSGQTTEALRLAQEVADRAEKTWGPEDTKTAATLILLGNLHGATGDYASAEPLLARAVAILERTSTDPAIAGLISDVKFTQQLIQVRQLLGAGKYDEALTIAQDMLTIAEKTWGPDNSNTAVALATLGTVYIKRARPNDRVSAEPLLARSLPILERTFKPDNIIVLASALALAQVYVADQNEARAAPLVSKVLPILNSSESQADQRYVLPLIISLAELYAFRARVNEHKDSYAHAEVLYNSCLKIAESAQDHDALFQCLTSFGRLVLHQGDSARAGSLFTRALSFLPDNDVIRQNEEVANLTSSGRFIEALPLAKKVSDLAERTLGDENLQTGTALSNLAYLYETNGDLERSEQIYVRALSVFDKSKGDDSSRVQIRFHLADNYMLAQEYGRAEQLLTDALAICEKASSAGQMDIVPCLKKMGGFYISTGDYVRAEPLFLRESRELGGRGDAYPAGDPTHGEWDRADLLASLAMVNYLRGDYAKAETMFSEGLAIKERFSGEDTLDLAYLLIGHADHDNSHGDNKNAEKLATQALTICTRILGPDGFLTAVASRILADSLSYQGEFAQAQKLYAQTSTVFEATFGPDSPVVRGVLNELGALAWQSGDPEETLKYIRRSVLSEERTATILGGSEAQKQAQLNSNLPGFAVSFYLQTARANPFAAHLAASAVLSRKGRVLEAAAGDFDSLRRHLSEDDRKVLDELVKDSSRLSTMVLNGPGGEDLNEYRTELQELRSRTNQLQAQMSARNTDFRLRAQAATVSGVQAALPTGSALVEFFVYSRYDPAAFPKPWGPEHYAAFVLLPSGDPAWADLGEAKGIDALCHQFRYALANLENSAQANEIARKLDQQVMQPVRRLLQGKTEIFLSPDGQLNLVPFAALRDENGRYLVERYQFTYLSTGRDLLRLQDNPASRQAAMILANPAYGYMHADTHRTGVPSRPFEPLPATAQEAESLKGLLPSAEIFEAESASKESLQKAAGPRVLHIATHGFFLEDLPTPVPVPFGDDSLGPCAARNRFHPISQFDSRKGLIDSIQGACSLGTGPRPLTENANPMLRSGLALAGANGTDGWRSDGILTAMEAANLDLRGTQLVVLSACDTGVGAVRNADGVVGLRRALVLAGSRAQMLSLWHVDDPATRDLMLSFYRNLLRAEGRSASLRKAQLGMLAHGFEPYYWAPFILSGDPGPLGK